MEARLGFAQNASGLLFNQTLSRAGRRFDPRHGPLQVVGVFTSPDGARAPQETQARETGSNRYYIGMFVYDLALSGAKPL